jgi:hypothetical protein
MDSGTRRKMVAASPAGSVCPAASSRGCPSGSFVNVKAIRKK